MKTINEQMKERAEAKIDAYKTALELVEAQIEFMPVVSHEIRMIKAGIEGCIIGSKNYIRSLK